MSLYWISRKSQVLYFIVIILSLFLINCESQLPAVEDLSQNPQLPDPLVMMDGTAVEKVEDWYQRRRPEIKKLFQHYMYGYFPEKTEIKFVIKKVDSTLFEGSAIYKEVEIQLHLPNQQKHSINLALFLPGETNKKPPVFMYVNKCGNHTLLDYDGISIIERPWIHPNCRNYYPVRGSRAHYWAIENNVKRGYAIATFHVADMDPDTLNWSDGIHAKYNSFNPDPLTQWSTLTAWAWGLQRVVDYFHMDSDIDTSRICITGWSRRGKAALLAAAFDDRIDLVVPHQSGTGGMALSRMSPEESVKIINDRFPHWFNGNFKKFNDDVTRLPVDQHLLVALIAPRPLMDNAGLQDTWASPHLALQSMKAASTVYEFLGEKGIVGKGFVRDELGDVEMGKLLQYQRDTEHTINIDYWNAMLDFADRQLGE